MPRRISESNPESALENAAAHLCSGLCTNGQGSGSARSIEAEQWNRLIDWCASSRLVFGDDSPPPDRIGGAEHDVRYDAVSLRWWKYTNPGFSGLTVDWVREEVPCLRMATPHEYFARLILQNQLFADDIRLEGLWMDRAGGGWRIVTSQPDVAGEPATLQQISESMATQEFEELPIRGVGRSGALAFRRGQFVVWDAHPANFVRTQEDVIVAIDVIITRLA